MLKAGHVIHSHKHTIELIEVKQKTCILKKQRDWSSECSNLVPKIMDKLPRC